MRKCLQLFTFVESFRNARVENGRLRQLELKKVQAATHNGRCAARCVQFPAVPRAAYATAAAMLHVSVSEPTCGTARHGAGAQRGSGPSSTSVGLSWKTGLKMLLNVSNKDESIRCALLRFVLGVDGAELAAFSLEAAGVLAAL